MWIVSQARPARLRCECVVVVFPSLLCNEHPPSHPYRPFVYLGPISHAHTNILSSLSPTAYFQLRDATVSFHQAARGWDIWLCQSRQSQ